MKLYFREATPMKFQQYGCLHNDDTKGPANIEERNLMQLQLYTKNWGILRMEKKLFLRNKLTIS